MSFEARYEVVALYRAEATVQTWEALGSKGRRAAVAAWEEKKEKEREREKRDG